MLGQLIATVLFAFAASQDCGVKPEQAPWSRILGGRDAAEGAWPWQLSLQYLRQSDQQWRHTCGAVLIDVNWALCAAHCTHQRDEIFRLVLGEHDHSVEDGSEQYVDVDLIIQHEDFIMSTLIGVPNDIALLRLAEPADLSNDNIGLACVPDESFGDFADHADTWMTGWGLTSWNGGEIPNILQEGLVDVPTNLECRVLGIVALRRDHICTGPGLPNACRGDSGGPINSNVNGVWYVTGLASFGDVFCAVLPSVYTRVTAFHEWIYTNMARYN